MSWSPDFEMVVFVTGELKLIQMTKEFDVLAEMPIQVEDFGSGKTFFF